DEWIYFFKHNSVKDEFTAKGLSKVRKVLLYENLTPNEKAEYDKILEVRRDNQVALDSALLRVRVEYELQLASEREEKEAALAREREKEAALARALAELEALKNNNQQKDL
ncbi:MAG: hypothetical protein LBS43_11075, partial [Prevotellaceae bacterium]|nr:hypothetical protein [Prevotellaceae bacterium]